MAGSQVTQFKQVDEAAERLVTAHQREAERDFFRFLGAVGFSEKLTSALSAQNLHALDHIKREKLYVAGGYQTFDDFLDHDPHSPMKADTFRRRWNLLTSEGDETFNLLNAMKVPFETRKLLAGQLEVTEDEIRIGGVGTRLDDNQRIIELISLLHKETIKQQRINEQGKKDVDKWKRRADEAEKRVIAVNPDATESGEALLGLAGAFTRLVDRLRDSSPEERDALRDPLFDLLQQRQLELSEIYLGRKPPKPADELADVSDDEIAEMLED